MLEMVDIEKELSDKHDKSLESCARVVISLSSSILALSVSLKTFVHLQDVRALYLLKIVWASLSVSILFGLHYLFQSAHKWLQALNSVRAKPDQSSGTVEFQTPKYRRDDNEDRYLQLSRFYGIGIYPMMASFLVGVVALVWFGYQNL